MPTFPRLFCAAASAGLLAMAAPAQAAFTGSYAPSHWSTSNTNGGNGTAVSDGSTLRLQSSDFANFDDAPLDASTLSYGIVAPTSVDITFSWSYLTNDDNGSSNDTFGYAVGTTFVQLSANGSYAPQSGTATVSVGAGNTFSFRSTSTDNLFGSAVTTVSGFEAVAQVPEAPAGLLAAAAIPFAVRWIRRRKPHAARRSLQA